MVHQWSRPLVRATSLVMSVAILVGVVACGGATKRAAPTRLEKGVSRLTVSTTTVLSARVRDLAVASPALGATAKVRLLLPAQYASLPRRRWPVVYLLHGCCDTYESWTRSTDIARLTARSDVLVVMPDGGKAVG
jgi:diacylglycerol O-acyltransferase/trehalose O-mycolyltransferase